jgi:uncharacterized protein YjbI with pentapeptide repeats
MGGKNSGQRNRSGEARLWHIGAALAVSFMGALLGLAALAIFAWFWLGWAGFRRHGVSLHDSVSVVQLIFASVAGAGALVALVVAYRRQKVAEADSTHDRTRVFNERFTTIATQLGAEQAAVRLAGVHAMAGLADDWNDHRQTCIDVLCAYLRMPYESDPGESASISERLAFQASREVRHTIIRIITAHLKSEVAVSWQGLNFDFTGVIFDGGDFRGAQFSASTVEFGNASFSGTVGFSGARFSGGTVSFGNAGFSGTVDFSRAEFSGGSVSFENAGFSGTADFSHAEFSGGKVSFVNAGFSGTVGFGNAKFSGGLILFSRARFSGTVDFSRAKFSGGSVLFQYAKLSGGTVDFSGAQFTHTVEDSLISDLSDFFYSVKWPLLRRVAHHKTRLSYGRVSFRYAEFSGSSVNFADAKFSGGQVDFSSAQFSDGTVDFKDARFSGGTVDFKDVKDWSNPPFFLDGSLPVVKLPAAVG